MALLSRDAILKAEDQDYDEVECPEWGGTVRLRSISGAERDTFEASCIVQKGNNRTVNMKNARAKLIVLMAVDEHGARLFSEDDVRALAKKNARPIDRLFDSCQKLAGITEDDMDQLTANLEETQTDDSVSV